MNLLNASIQRVAKRLRRVASRLGCRTSVQRDVHGVTHTFPGVGTSTPSVTASAGQSSSRNTQDTFDYGPQEIGMSQLQDAPSTQQTQLVRRGSAVLGNGTLQARMLLERARLGVARSEGLFGLYIYTLWTV